MRACVTSCREGGPDFFKHATFSEHFNATAGVRPVKYKDNTSKPLLVSKNVLTEVQQMVDGKPK